MLYSCSIFPFDVGAVRRAMSRCAVVIATTCAFAAAAATFPGTDTGAIPDSTVATCGSGGAPRHVRFNVTGMSAPLTDIRVSLTLSHAWAGDLVATLLTPGGEVSFPLFGRIGLTSSTGGGTSDNFNGTYEFVDPAVSLENIWTVATASATELPAGVYATTPVGAIGVSNPPPLTGLVAAFAALTTAQINGEWRIRFQDFCGGDTGSVTAASLSLDATPAPPARLAWAPRTLQFDPHPAGLPGPALPIVLAAPASNGLHVVDVNPLASACSITGANAAQFAVVSGAVAVAASETKQLLVQFRPVGTGIRTATLTCPLTSVSTTVTPNTLEVQLIGYAGTLPPVNCYDLDGDGNLIATVDGLVMLRAMLGLSGTALTEGITPPGPRSTVKRMLDFARTRCGLPNP